MTATGYGTARTYLHLALMAAGQFLVGTNAFVIAGLMPAIAAGLGTSQTAVAYSVTLYSLVIAVVSPVASIVLVRVSRTVLMSSGLALLATGTLIAAWATTVVGFDAGRTVAALGGALFMPTATAAGPSIVARGKAATAIAIVMVGFSLAVAVGSPVGSAVGTAFGWRMPFVFIGLGGFVVAAVLALVVRRVPIPPAVPFAQRVAPLRDRRVVIGLLTTTLLILGFNTVYLRVASVADGVTGGDGGMLAALLLVLGVFGVLGTLAAGPLTDRFGARPVLTIAVAVQVAALVWIGFGGGSFPAAAVAFAFWGLGVFASPIAVQERLVAVDPPTAALTISWANSVQYLGLALAPVLSAGVVSAMGAGPLPVVGAAIIALAALAFHLGFRGGFRAASLDGEPRGERDRASTG